MLDRQSTVAPRRTTWQRIVAREWLWLVASVVAMMVYTRVGPYRYPSDTWFDTLVFSGLLFGLPLYLLIGVGRLTVWAVRTLWR